jgi:methionyl-tRNA formyltransferase
MHAPKITTEDGRVDWYRWPAEKVLAYSRVFPLWDTTTYRACTGKEPLRVKFEGKWRKLDPHTISSDDMAYSRMGAPFLCQIQGEKGWKLAFETVDGQVLSPDAASIESREPGKGLQALVQGLQKAKQNSRL